MLIWKLLQLESADLYLSFSSCSFLVSCVVVVCCCSVAQSSPTLCDLMDCSMSGFPVLHRLPEFAQTHVHWVGDAIKPSPPALHLSQHQGIFQWVSSSHQVTQVLELQLWHQSFQWIFRVDFLWDWLVWSPCSPWDYSNTTVPKHPFFGAQPSLWSNSHIYTWLLEKP